MFAEVNLRRRPEYGDLLKAVDARKRSTIRSLAEREPGFEVVRFDVVGNLAGRRKPRVTHIRDAF